MFRIMIVDDEHTIRKGLINFIDWNTLGCMVLCEADNGILARDLLHTETPDIVIADIKMPGLDGIGLAQYVYENMPQIKMILLTGYSDFEYAQSAIKYNVVDFVLKPSSTDQLMEAVNKAKKLIIREKIEKDKMQRLENAIKENLSQIQEKFLQDLVNGVFIHTSNIFHQMQRLKIDIHNFYVLVYRIEKLEYVESSTKSEKNRNILLEIKNFISMIFKEFQHYTLIVDSKNLCTLISFDDSRYSQGMQIILSRSEEILNFVNHFMNIPISIGISERHTNPSEVQSAFREARKCLSHKFYDDGNIFVYSKFAACGHLPQETVTHQYIDNIIKYIESGSTQQAVEILRELFEYQKNAAYPIEHIKTTSIVICSLCSRLLGNFHVNFCDIVRNGDTIYAYILNCESIKDLRDTLETIIRTIGSSLSLLSTQHSYIISKVMAYIEENYQSPIKLDMLADYVHVNSCYLSRLFSKETGTTLTETITRIRIEKAKELLVSNNSKTYEIASMVGFEDPSYFSCVFKKYTSLSPNQFRKQHR
ncbi:MAG: response regulator [Bacillota bacterium]